MTTFLVVDVMSREEVWCGTSGIFKMHFGFISFTENYTCVILWKIIIIIIMV